MLLGRRIFPVLVALFLFSILIRIPTLNRPLSKHHEFCTAVALRVMQIWDQAGITAYHFNPVMTYPNAADKFINNYASGSGNMLDAEGNYYYVSHPPLAYYVPYFFFQVFGVRPDVLPIQVLNLVLHFLSALGIFFIVKRLTPPLSEGEGVRAFSPIRNSDSLNVPSPLERARVRHFAALAAFIFYLFSAATMWFQSNTYMSDMAVQPLFIYGTLLALKFFESRKKSHLLLLSLFVFLMTYITWLGVFFSATLILFTLFHWKHLQHAALIASLIFTGAAAAIAITVFQYSQIAGFDAYYTEAFGRFSERSGMQNGVGHFLLLSKTIAWNYVTSYLPLLVLVALLLSVNKFRAHGVLKVVPFAVIPVLLLHLVLPNYSGHDFVSLYGSVFLSIAAGAASLFLLEKSRWMFNGVLGVYVLVSGAHYYYINRPGEISQRGDRYADFKDVGEAIRQLAKPDEVVFLLDEKPAPEVVFYAGRNILQVANGEEAMQHLRLSPASEGVILKRAVGNTVEIVSRVEE